MTKKQSATSIIKDIKRKTRRKFEDLHFVGLLGQAKENIPEPKHKLWFIMPFVG